jgi:HlyD family secretion protein
MTRTRFFVIGIVSVVLGIGITTWIFRGKSHDALANGPADSAKEPTKVKVIHPKKGALERLCVQPGSVQSFESVSLYAKVPGFLESQTVDIGNHVKQDDVLAVVNVPDIKATVARDTAAVQKATAKRTQMKSRVDVAKANLDAAKAAVVQAEAKFRADTAWVKYRTIEFGRMQNLVSDKALEKSLEDQSKQHFDSAIESENASRAAIATAKANVVAGAAKIEEAKADVIEAEAEIEYANAVLKRSKVDLDFATVKAPFDGVIAHRGMFPGAFVNSADNGKQFVEPLFIIDRTDLFRVVVLIPERDVRFIHKGTTAMMDLDALPGQRLPITVARFANSLDKRTRLMRVEFDLKNPTGEIYNDMYGQVTIVLERGSDLLSIPSPCLASKPAKGKATVYVVRAGKAEKTEVELVMDTGVRVAVKGLTADDQVILNPNNDLAGQPAVIPVLTKD